MLESFVDHKGALDHFFLMGWDFQGRFLDEVLNFLDLDTWDNF